jgi:hypothetical protein
MTTTIYNEAIQTILDDLNNLAEGEEWGDVWNAVSDDRDRKLGKTLLNRDDHAFIVVDGDHAFVFISDDQTQVWTVEHVGNPVYVVEPEMVGDADVDFDDFFAELQNALPGVKVRRGDSYRNQGSEFVEWFRSELDEAFQKTLSYL